MKKFKFLSDVYAAIPDVECKMLCSASCNTIAMSELEHRRLMVKGVNVPRLTSMQVTAITSNQAPSVPCPALVDGMCSVHPLRPVICRLYGAVDDPRMDCGHGCAVPSGKLTTAEAMHLLGEARRIGGGSTIKPS